MRKMKVLAFVEYLPPRLGSDRRIFEIMKRLAGRHEVHFMVFPPFRELRDKSFVDKRDSRTYSGNEEVIVRCEGILGHSVPVSSRVSLLWQHSLIVAYLVTAISVFMRSFRILKKIDPDVIVLNYPSPYTGLLGFLEGRILRKKVVVDFNDLIAQYIGALLNLDQNSLTAKLLAQVQRFIVRNSDQTIAPTRFIRDYAVSSGVPENKVSIIPNGVDTKMFDLNGSNPAKMRRDLHLNNEKICVYSGRLDGWAGINITLRLSDIARRKKLNVRFLLVGSGESKNIQEENILYLGEMPPEKIPSVLSVADVVLIPFPNNEVSHAASPLKLFEGMSMQKPIVASRVSGIQDVILDGENGFLADPDNPDEWIQKLEAILNSEALAARIGENAKRTVEERFDWDLLAKQYEEVLNASCLN
jgi:colanic acid biosynthesis glycosyl transferase WcaI